MAPSPFQRNIDCTGTAGKITATATASKGQIMTAIIDIHAREILDSRGNPTVEVDVVLETKAQRDPLQVVH